MKTLTGQPDFFRTLFADGCSLLGFVGWGLVACGGFALFQSATGQLLPHDARYLGMTADELCALHQCRVLHFMFHDRVAFGGVLIALGTLYLWLTEFPMRGGEGWAWWAIGVSGTAGFASFLTFLGYGYLDLWHGVATMVLCVCFTAGLWRTRGMRAVASRVIVTPRYRGWTLLLVTGMGLVAAGLTITIVGATTVFVPQDIQFMGVTPAELRAINPHLIPLIAHDRAGFGGALLSCGLAWTFCVLYGAPSRALWQALGTAGAIGFAAAIGVHLVVGYLNLVHLGPALLGAGVFAAGLWPARQPMCRDRETNQALPPTWVSECAPPRETNA